MKMSRKPACTRYPIPSVSLYMTPKEADTLEERAQAKRFRMRYHGGGVYVLYPAEQGAKLYKRGDKYEYRQMVIDARLDGEIRAVEGDKVPEFFASTPIDAYQLLQGGAVRLRQPSEQQIKTYNARDCGTRNRGPNTPSEDEMDAPVTKVATIFPETDIGRLRDLVKSINAIKGAMGDDMVISVTGDGKLAVTIMTTFTD